MTMCLCACARDTRVRACVLACVLRVCVCMRVCTLSLYLGWLLHGFYVGLRVLRNDLKYS